MFFRQADGCIIAPLAKKALYAFAQFRAVLALLFFLRLTGFFLASFSAAFFAARLRRRISSGEYMVPRHFFAPQLQMASSSPPS